MSEEYDFMTTEQLEKRNEELMAERDAILAEQRRIQAALTRKVAMARLAQMEPAEKAALAQAIKDAGGIVSDEMFGEF